MFAGRAPFPEEGVVGGVHSMLNGRRPARPPHPEMSNRLWEAIKRSWKADPAKRKTIIEVIAVLEAEVNTGK